MCFFRFTKDNIQGSKFNEMNDFTASSRTFLSETGILKKYRKCMREEYTDSSYNLMPVSWFILKQQQFYPHYFCIINANVSGKGVSHLSITVKILLTSQNPWKDLRDFQGTTDQTLMTHCLKSFPSSLWLWTKQAEAWYQRSTVEIYVCVYIYVYIYIGYKLLSPQTPVSSLGPHLPGVHPPCYLLLVRNFTVTGKQKFLTKQSI